MKEYIEYNTKQGITDLLSEIELDDEKGWVEGMHKGEMIASIKVPEEGYTFTEEGEIISSADAPRRLRIDYLASLRPVSFDFKIVKFHTAD